MTEQERQDLRDFHATVTMGWREGQSGYDHVWFMGTQYDRGDGYMIEARVRVQDYRPDSPDAPASQLLGVIDAMRKRGFKVVISWGEVFQACFISPKGNEYYYNALNLPDAVLLAARAALEEGE